MNIDFWDIFLLLLMLLLSGLFSGIEIAFVSSNKLKIELKSAQGDRVGIILSRFVKQTPRVLTTILVGNNLALVIYGIFIAKVLNNLFAVWGILDPIAQPYPALILQTVISTMIILVFGEYLPKAFFRLKAERIMFNIVTARFLQIWYRIFGPFVVLINSISAFFLKRILRLKYEEEELVFSRDDLAHYIQESLHVSGESPDAPEIDAEMFTNAMSFNETRVREFMVPRTEIQALPHDSTIEELIDKFVETGHSKLIIHGENIDEIIGIVHSNTLFTRPKSIAEVIQPLLHVPETMAANVLLSEFTKNRKTIAIVVDEFGGTAGIVTIEDLVEEVFGEIEDEHDEPEEDELLARRIDENNWLFSARWEVDALNEEYELGLPEGEYTTLGGLILHLAESIPAKNETLDIEGYRFIITSASANKVDEIKIQRRAQ
ncbi:MAG: hemolysin family protein [Bacteroidota bacterium]